MLLSPLTWLIHILTVTEWLVAILLFWRYGTLIARQELRIFALCMTPHLLGGLSILAFHLGGDTQPALLAAARLLTFAGSLLLLAATLSMALGRGGGRAWRIVPAGWLGAGAAWRILPAGWLGAGAAWLIADDAGAAILKMANVCYLLFLLTLLWVHRRDRTLFSPVTIAGFWFLLVFVAVTIVTTRIATLHLGLPSLAHHDLLHGLSESLLTVANLLVVSGLYGYIRRWRAIRDPSAVGS